jgi:hypothetical protein
MKLFGFSLYHDCSRMDIGLEAAVGMSFGMTDVFTEHRRFSANITFQGVFSLELLAITLQTSVQ